MQTQVFLSLSDGVNILGIDFRLQRYKDYKIRVCGKDSILCYSNDVLFKDKFEPKYYG